MARKQIQKKLSPTQIVLGGKVGKFKDHQGYELAKTVPTAKKSRFKVKNPATGKTAIVTISRTGTSEEQLGMIMLAPDATREQRDSMLAQYLFEQGKESASFLAEIFRYKGQHAKETQAFKSNMRRDFELFADKVAQLFQDIGDDLLNKSTSLLSPDEIFRSLGERFKAGADLIFRERERISSDREREKGKGIYLARDGKAYSVDEPELMTAIIKDRKETTK